MLSHAGNINATPQSYREARHSSEWVQWEIAMKEELAKMESYKVWEVVDKIPQQRVVDGKWVCTKKIDGATGKPHKYKARWVAKGFKQIEGFDYNELFAAVAHKDSIMSIPCPCQLLRLRLWPGWHQSSLSQWWLGGNHLDVTTWRQRHSCKQGIAP
jgi:hypothetical protein